MVGYITHKNALETVVIMTQIVGKYIVNESSRALRNSRRLTDQRLKSKSVQCVNKLSCSRVWFVVEDINIIIFHYLAQFLFPFNLIQNYIKFLD